MSVLLRKLKSRGTNDSCSINDVDTLKQKKDEDEIGIKPSDQSRREEALYMAVCPDCSSQLAKYSSCLSPTKRQT